MPAGWLQMTLSLTFHLFVSDKRRSDERMSDKPESVTEDIHP
jgi:hypothetical protein